MSSKIDFPPPPNSIVSVPEGDLQISICGWEGWHDYCSESKPPFEMVEKLLLINEGDSKSL